MRNPSLPRVRLHPRRAMPFWCGHAWVLSGAIASSSEPDLAPGHLVLVEDDQGRAISVGVFHPDAQLRVRLLDVAEEEVSVTHADALPAHFWLDRLRVALDCRRRHGLPSRETTGYRVINGEGDRIPGLIVDRLGDTAVLHVTAAFQWAAAPRWAQWIREEVGVRHCWVTVDALAAAREGLPEGTQLLCGDATEAVTFLEGGLRFRADVAQGQKTGFFLDQRDNRARFAARIQPGERVLDAYAYTGAFALYALRAGAAEAVAVDSSASALEGARAHAADNGLDSRLTSVQAKVEHYLRSCVDRGERFDHVSLDPPKLAAGDTAVDGALRKLRHLCADALRLLAPGGQLFVSSCSHRLGVEELVRTLREASGSARVGLTVEGTSGHPPDHPWPAAMGEMRYLSALQARRL